MSHSSIPADLLHATGVEPAVLGRDFESLAGPVPIPGTARGATSIHTVVENIRSGKYRFEYVQCPCGASGRDVVVARIDRYRLPHRTVLCGACGLSRTNPRLDSASYIDFYANHYRAIYERPGDSAANLIDRQQANARRRYDLVQRSAPRPPRSVIELGCAAGWNLVPYRDAGCRVEGYDYDHDYLDAGRARGLAMHHGGVDEALAAGQRFDLVILSHVVEHMLDPGSEVGRICGLLEPGGLVFIEVPSILAAGHPLLRYFQSAHTFSFCPETLTDTLRASRLSPIHLDASVASIWHLDDAASSRDLKGTPELAQRILDHLAGIRPPSRVRQVAHMVRQRLGIGISGP